MIFVLIFVIVIWGFTAFLVFATGVLTVASLKILSRQRAAGFDKLLLVSALVSGVATHFAIMHFTDGYYGPGARGSAAGFLQAIDWRRVFEAASLFVPAALIPGFIWCAGRSSTRRDRPGLVSNSSAALSTYFRVAPVALPVWWFVLVFLM